MQSVLLLVALGPLVALGHEYFPGACPKFTPMDGFDWDQVGRITPSLVSQL